ncbi:hypothetical protein DERF_012126 [Dermatophagoides farinae]|uniref:Uncharacterized protein n=1 Tax=Dermatophagoides farinae TaxID=6954 RepID=A0A922HR88_DERFA|nr:hypothetical protein DERF_012126 [Dermatophagoides farinae]
MKTVFDAITIGTLLAIISRTGGLLVGFIMPAMFFAAIASIPAVLRYSRCDTEQASSRAAKQPEF